MLRGAGHTGIGCLAMTALSNRATGAREFLPGRSQSNKNESRLPSFDYLLLQAEKSNSIIDSFNYPISVCPDRQA